MIPNLFPPFSAISGTTQAGKKNDPGSSSRTQSSISSLGSILGKRKANTPLFNTDKINSYKNIPDASEAPFTTPPPQGLLAVLVSYESDPSDRSLLFYADAKRIKDGINNHTFSIFASEGPSRDCFQLKLQDGDEVRTCYLRSTGAAGSFFGSFVRALDIEADDCILFLKDGSLTEQFEQYSQGNPEHPQIVTASSTGSSDLLSPSNGSYYPISKPKKSQPKRIIHPAEKLLFAASEARKDGATTETISFAIQQKHPNISPEFAAVMAIGALAAQKEGATVETIDRTLAALPPNYPIDDYTPVQALAATMPEATIASVTAAKFRHLKSLWKLEQPCLSTIVSIAVEYAAQNKDRPNDELTKLVTERLTNFGVEEATITPYSNLVKAAVYASKPGAVQAECISLAGNCMLGEAIWFAKRWLSPRTVSTCMQNRLEINEKIEDLSLSIEERWLAANLQERPEWWHPPVIPSTEAVLSKLLHYGEEAPQEVLSLLSTIAGRVDAGIIEPDHKLLLLLFHFKPEAEKFGINPHDIDTIILSCMKNMSLPEKRLTARFVAMIDTREGQALRNQLFPYLYCHSGWSSNKDYQLPEGHCGWFSTQETLRRQIAAAEDLLQRPIKPQLKAFYPSGLEGHLGNPGAEEALLYACKRLVKQANKKMRKLEQGTEVNLPKYYQDAGNADFYSNIALTRIRLITSRDDSATELYTRILRVKQKVLIAYSDFMLWDQDATAQSMPDSPDVKQKGTMPLYLNDTLLPVALIVQNVAQQKKAVARILGSSHTSVSGILQAMLEQYCLDKAAPLLWPLHWTGEQSINSEIAAEPTDNHINI